MKKVSRAISATQALDMVKNRLMREDYGMYALILINFSMPVIKGIDCIKTIRDMVMSRKATI